MKSNHQPITTMPSKPCSEVPSLQVFWTSSPQCTSAESDFQVLSQSRGIRACVTRATHSGLANVTLDLQEQERMGCPRPSQSLSGLLLTLWQVCQPAATSWDNSGHPLPGHTQATALSHWLQSWSCACFHLYSLCQWTFCQGGYISKGNFNLNLLLLSVFLFFWIVELAWGSSVPHLEGG